MTVKSATALVETAKAAVNAVSIEEMKRLVADGAAEVIDVRDGSERQTKASIKGSHHASRGMLEFYIDPMGDFHKDVFSADKTLIFVCGSGARASLAAQTAKTMGLEKIVYLEGGMNAWIAAGEPTVDAND